MKLDLHPIRRRVVCLLAITGIVAASAFGVHFGVRDSHVKRLIREPSPFHVEISHWPVRMEFLRRMMRDDASAEVLVRDWQSHFQAVTGQDVSLAHRNEMMAWLDVFARNPSTPQGSRDTAILWMGLIVLTDPDAFAPWRVPVRDGMLACDNPPMAHSGDVWMRVLDVLLAFDPPEHTATLTAVLMRDPILMRRALRERVRGVENFMPQMMEELARLDGKTNPHEPLAMWLDMKHLTDRLPEHPEHPERGEIRLRLASMMATWLVEDARSVRQRFLFRQRLAEDVVIEMPDAMRAQLANHAHGLLEDFAGDVAAMTRRDSIPAKLEQAVMIRNFLDEPRRTTLSRDIADALLNWQGNPDTTWYWFTASLMWRDLDATQQPRIASLLRQLLDTYQRGRRRRGMDWVFGFTHPMHELAGLSTSEQFSMFAYFGCFKRLSSPRENLGYAARENEDWIAPDFPIESMEDYLKAWRNALGQRHRKLIQKSPLFLGGTIQHESHDAMHLGISLDDYVRRALATRGLISPDQLAWQDFLTLAASKSETVLQVLSTRPPVDRDWLADEEKQRQLLEALLKNPYGLALYMWLVPESLPARPQAIRQWIERMKSMPHEQQEIAYRILLRVETSLDEENQKVARAMLFDAIDLNRPALTEWGAYDLLGGVAYEEKILSWQEDELTARHGWRQQLLDEFRIMRRVAASDSRRYLFRHLYAAHNIREYVGEVAHDPHLLGQPIPANAWLTHPPELPLEPTAWQRARALSLKRPDLEFPDRTLLRPGKAGAHASSKSCSPCIRRWLK